jgi:hypothetical protein
MPGGKIVHWKNGGGAVCGAAASAVVSFYPHAVTCPECVIALKVDVLRRRLVAHRQSLLLGGARRRDTSASLGFGGFGPASEATPCPSALEAARGPVGEREYGAALANAAAKKSG